MAEPDDPGPDLRRPRRLPSPTAVVTAVVVAASVLFTLLQLEPGLLLADTTPAGGDMGAHVWAPAYLRDVLLPSGRLAGWTPDWYAGFPAYHFYMVVPSLAIVALDGLLPYNVAFKLVTVSGLLTLPVAAWALGRLARAPFPVPALLSVGAVGFLFERSFTIYGGNLASTLAGEFAFSISLSVALVFVGVVLRGLDDGRRRALAAALLGLCALCHVIPAIFALAAAALALALRPRTAGLRWLLPSVVVGSLLTAFWTVPFVLRRPYLNDMGWEKTEQYWEHLLPGRLGDGVTRLLGGAAEATVSTDVTVVALLALAGAVASLVRRQRLGTFLAVLAPAFAVAFVLAPQGRLWNARLLPFWFLCLYLLAAIALAEAARAVARLAVAGPAPADARPPAVVGAAAVVLAAVGLGWVAFPLRVLPLGRTSDDGTRYQWAAIESADRSFLPDWVRWNYSGYERKDAWPEYRDVVSTMGDLGRENGCGRAMWEYSPGLDRYGTPMALMLLPYWTDGCIGSMEGLYFEASATTPYHFLNQALLSEEPSNAQRDLPYGTLDVAAGVERLQLLGVRYYLASSAAAIAQADAEPDLERVAGSGPWQVYEVADAPLVAPLEAEPAVLEGVAGGGREWLEPAVDWYGDPSSWAVPLAADGPSSWQRVEPGEPVDRQAVPPVTVRDVVERRDSIRFEVSEPGTPVLVKTSYFPNWRVEGADGPWRVAPNLMVVVPTDTEVELSYGTTTVEWGAWALSLLGLAGLALLWRLGPVVLPARRPPPDEGDGPGPEPGGAEPVEHDREPVPVPATVGAPAPG